MLTDSLTVTLWPLAAPDSCSRGAPEGGLRASVTVRICHAEPGSFLSLQRPWHEYEHNFQIMYKVGMGHKPPIPERLSPEGKDFLSHCLESDPKMRWTASQLLDHAFVKVWPIAEVTLFRVKHFSSVLHLAQEIWKPKHKILISKIDKK